MRLFPLESFADRDDELAKPPVGRGALEPPVPQQRRPHRRRPEREITELQSRSPDHHFRDSPAERRDHVRLAENGSRGKIGQARPDSSLRPTGRAEPKTARIGSPPRPQSQNTRKVLSVDR